MEARTHIHRLLFPREGLDQITVRYPRPRDLIAMEQMFKGADEGELTLAEMVKVAALLSDVDEAIMADLETEDFEAISEVAAVFLARLKSARDAQADAAPLSPPVLPS